MPNMMGYRRLWAWGMGTLFSLCGLSIAHAANDAPIEAGVTPRPAIASDEVDLPLYEHEPFDEIQLNSAAGGAVLKVRPLDFPGRQVPANPTPRENLRLQILDRPDESYDLAWRHIERIVLFEQRILAEAERLVAAKHTNEAFQFYSLLYRDYPYTPGLKESAGRFLVESAFAAFQREQWEHALMYLLEVRRIDPNRVGLVKALGRVYDKILGQHVAEKRYLQARQVLQAVQQDATLREFEPLAAWSGRLTELAARLRQTALDKLQAGQFEEAHATYRQLQKLRPDFPDSSALLAHLQERYPLISVGVTLSRGPDEADSLLHWGQRRAQRLLRRQLMELESIGPEGGRYECPLGTVQPDGQDQGFMIVLRSDPQAELGQATTAHDVATQLLAMANPSSALYRGDWRSLLSDVSVRDADQVRADLVRPHLRIESLLRVGLVELLPSNAPITWSLCSGYRPYLEDPGSGKEVAYRRNAAYRLGTDSQPQRVVEVSYADPTRALAALERGEIDVVDRLFPADVGRLKNRQDLVVERYAVPSLHVLIPNNERPHVGHSVFRRAISYSIDRAALLKEEILGGSPLPGCEPLSGPLPIGVGDDDPLGYGYDRRILPHLASAELSFMLSQVAQQTLIARAAQRQEPPPALGTLKLYHPADELPRNVCRVIAARLSSLRIPCVAEELPAGSVRPAGNDWDLLYAELSIAEPLTDIGRLLGADGIVQGTSDYLRAALVNLNRATNWKEARDRLMEVHRLAHDECAVIPLWQLVDHFAYGSHLQGLGRSPVSLYQHVEKWQWRPSIAGLGE